MALTAVAVTVWSVCCVQRHLTREAALGASKRLCEAMSLNSCLVGWCPVCSPLCRRSRVAPSRTPPQPFWCSSVDLDAIPPSLTIGGIGGDGLALPDSSYRTPSPPRQLQGLPQPTPISAGACLPAGLAYVVVLAAEGHLVLLWPCCVCQAMSGVKLTPKHL